MTSSKKVALSDKFTHSEQVFKTPYRSLDAEENAHLRPGIDLLLTRQVAAREQVTPRTVERWIDKGLPAYQATRQQLGVLVQDEYLSRLPPHGIVLLIKQTDLDRIPQLRAYPPQTKRPRRGTAKKSMVI